VNEGIAVFRASIEAWCDDTSPKGPPAGVGIEFGPIAVSDNGEATITGQVRLQDVPPPSIYHFDPDDFGDYSL
jgi:hypothetical protein